MPNIGVNIPLINHINAIILLASTSASIEFYNQFSVKKPTDTFTNEITEQ